MESRLLKLAGELRNHIYELVAADGLPVTVKHVGDDGSPGKGTFAGLTRTCRQIRTECLPVYRQYARISIHYEDLVQWTRLQSVLVHELHVQISKHHRELNRVDWLPIIRARAISLSSQGPSNSPFRTKVHFAEQGLKD
ncbi:hypothetical protein DPSP01_002496 [Paraphaeosphaeria sporulosa]|uniref:Uncharacterized protein n=1 Tax=Paraphaeosphaeria sporulosa TaxID=1460663 RepID=A0A177CV30_9PLEO|nr:uncharacterized protein CC84DRAFT_1211044 [Paraphaeosphaeria sporulosa]OAG11383.1 hypothetical protein CC84DRAFT_1211044 [Paraphaeosphaeria sporulosa]